MDIDSAGDASTCISGKGSNVGEPHNAPASQTQAAFASCLDTLSHDMMDVDPHTSVQTSPGLVVQQSLNGLQARSGHHIKSMQASHGGHNRKLLPTPGVSQGTGYSMSVSHGRNFFLHTAPLCARGPSDDAAGAPRISPVPTPPVVVVLSSDMSSWP
jgi:hypothetical protein